MRSLVTYALVAAVAILLYRAYRQHYYVESELTSSGHRTVLQAADELNARDQAEVNEILAKARAGGELDVARLRTLLRQSAITAGQLRDLGEELRALSGGAPAAAPGPQRVSPPAGSGALPRNGPPQAASRARMPSPR